jgi:excisionase family DNA binding protein
MSIHGETMITAPYLMQAAYNIRQAADLTGFHRNTISRAIRTGILPAKAYGNRRVVILRGDIDRWLADLPAYTNGYTERAVTKAEQN